MKIEEVCWQEGVVLYTSAVAEGEMSPSPIDL